MSKAAAKEKVVTVKGTEATELVLTYLLRQNRPYGATDVSTNLHGKVTKLQCQKIMAALAEEGEITVKPYGKTLIYCVKQKGDSEEQEDGASGSGNDVKEEIESLKQMESQLKQELASLSAGTLSGFPPIVSRSAFDGIPGAYAFLSCPNKARTILIQSGPPTITLVSRIDEKTAAVGPFFLDSSFRHQAILVLTLGFSLQLP